MTSDFAKTLASISLPAILDEWKTTKKVIAAIPDDQVGFKPDPKSATALERAWHIASTDIWFMQSIGKGEFEWSGGNGMPENIKTAADCIAYYESNVDAAAKSIEGLTGEQLVQNQDFFGVFNMPRVMYLNFLDKHSVHHRGQLSVYLRLMGSKCPSIYGGSADEPFQAPPVDTEAATA